METDRTPDDDRDHSAGGYIVEHGVITVVADDATPQARVAFHTLAEVREDPRYR